MSEIMTTNINAQHPNADELTAMIKAVAEQVIADPRPYVERALECEMEGFDEGKFYLYYPNLIEFGLMDIGFDHDDAGIDLNYFFDLTESVLDDLGVDVDFEIDLATVSDERLARFIKGLRFDADNIRLYTDDKIIEAVLEKFRAQGYEGIYTLDDYLDLEDRLREERADKPLHWTTPYEILSIDLDCAIDEVYFDFDTDGMDDETIDRLCDIICDNRHETRFYTLLNERYDALFGERDRALMELVYQARREAE